MPASNIAVPGKDSKRSVIYKSLSWANKFLMIPFGKVSGAEVCLINHQHASFQLQVD